jgi:hypothetical protein
MSQTCDVGCFVEGEKGPCCCMLQPLIFDVANVVSRCCRHVLLGVANIKFLMLRVLSFDVANI